MAAARIGQPPDKPGLIEPDDPALEEHAQARPAVIDGAQRLGDLGAEALGGPVERLDLQRLFRLEVREEPTLRKAEPLGERPDGETAKPLHAGKVDRLVENARTRAVALGEIDHRKKIARSFGSAKVAAASRIRDWPAHG